MSALPQPAAGQLAFVQHAKRKIILSAIMLSLDPQSPGLKLTPECFKRPPQILQLPKKSAPAHTHDANPN